MTQHSFQRSRWWARASATHASIAASEVTDARIKKVLELRVEDLDIHIQLRTYAFAATTFA